MLDSGSSNCTTRILIVTSLIIIIINKDIKATIQMKTSDRACSLLGQPVSRWYGECRSLSKHGAHNPFPVNWYLSYSWTTAQVFLLVWSRFPAGDIILSSSLSQSASASLGSHAKRVSLDARQQSLHEWIMMTFLWFPSREWNKIFIHAYDVA